MQLTNMIGKTICDNNLHCTKNPWQKVVYSKKSSRKNTFVVHPAQNFDSSLSQIKTAANISAVNKIKPTAVHSNKITKSSDKSRIKIVAIANNSVQQRTIIANKTSAAGNAATNSNSVCSAPIGTQPSVLRRRRSNQQEVRQIKRAHRHLLTSGGTDWQQPGAVTVQKQKLKLAKQQQQQQQQQQTKNCQAKQSATKQKQKQVGKIENLEKNAHSGGAVSNQCSGGATTVATKKRNRNRTKLQQQKSKKQHHKHHSCGLSKEQHSEKQKQLEVDSVISSSWCSIEEQLDLLDKLLYFCDEEQQLQAVEYRVDDEEDDYATAYRRNKTKSNRATTETAAAADYYVYTRGAEELVAGAETTATVCGHWSECDYDYDNYETTDLMSDQSETSGAGSSTSSPLVPTSLKRRGHQHHPRFSGTRRPNVPNVQEILAALYRGDSQSALSNLRGETGGDGSDLESLSTLDDNFSQYTDDQPDEEVNIDVMHVNKSLNLPLTDSVTTSLGSNSPTPTDDSSMLDEGVSSSQISTTTSIKSGASGKVKSPKREKGEKGEKATSSEKKTKKSKKDKNKRASACLDDLNTQLSAKQIDGNANVDEGISIDDEDSQSAEWAQLRCTSEAAEIVAEREARRNKGRCADYPGLAFGRSIFSSDTMMKFNIIRNELHNIMNTQLKRVIGK